LEFGLTRLRIRHETIYDYPAPTTFGAWRLRMRPMDAHGQRVINAWFDLTPPGPTRWTYDAYGNSVCHFTPLIAAPRLSVVSHVLVERFPAPLWPLDLHKPPITAPITYDEATRTIIAPFIHPATPDDDAYRDWLIANAVTPGETALDYLVRLNRAIHSGFTYETRETGAPRIPAATIAQGSGSCRDLAWLMIESVRRLGFGARFVSGYLHAGTGIVGGGSTHAWCDVYLPDLGWIEFDPTNGLVESPDLIRVAVARTPGEAAPMEGLAGTQEATLTVHIDVTPAGADDAVATP
jgi:transglutaminase-like putative cysteine protease